MNTKVKNHKEPSKPFENETPDWLLLPWINKSDIFRELAGSTKKSKSDYYWQKIKGLRRWNTAELTKLEKIRKKFVKDLSA